MNGGRNYNGPKVHTRALVKSNYMRETPQQPVGTRLLSQAVKIRWTWGQSAGKASMMDNALEQDQEEPSETLRSITGGMKLEAQWVVGFVDGEGCFYVGVNQHPGMSNGFQVLPEFTVVQHERDVQLLYALKNFFGCGVVRQNHGDRMAYRVRSLEHLLKRIVPFFEKHPLKSKKRVDFIRFRRILLMMERNEHLTMEGIEKIRRIASQMNTARER